MRVLLSWGTDDNDNNGVGIDADGGGGGGGSVRPAVAATLAVQQTFWQEKPSTATSAPP